MSARLGTAEWADPALVAEKYPYRDGTIWLGRSTAEQPASVGYADDRHVCLVSGSRGGKGTTSIVNNLTLWPGSICVVDPKGENATITASRRGNGSSHSKGLGQTVQVLDPFNAAQIDDSLRGRFNPLDALDPDNDETIDEAGRIADAVVVIHETNDPFWDESARSMVKGLILHVLTAPSYEGRRNLATVRKLVMRGDTEATETLRELGERESDIPSPHFLLWTGLVNNPAFGGLLAGIGDMFTNMLRDSPKQYESVLQVANRNTEFIDSPAMQRCLEASDFQLSDLKTLPGGLSLYLCLPQRYMSTHYRWLRMMIALIVTEMEKVRGRPATGHPILMVLDEFAGLKRMEVIENAVAQIAGYGVKLFFVLQSLEQLKAVYKNNWETFLANSGLKVFFNVEDHFSREYVSKLIGETEVIREVRSSSDSVSQFESTSRSVTRSRSETRGRSSSTGTSESEGTNTSVSTGKSWSSNTSESRSQNYTYAQGWIFRRYDEERIGDNRSQSSGFSVSQTKGESRALSHGTSRSRTHGTSISSTTGFSETEGTTRGTSQSRTAGKSETIQKRPLITPDEIGQVFARIDDRRHRAYPGLALAIISGAPPMAVHRVNYYEDFQFVGLFDPPPEHPFLLPEELTVDGRSIGPVFLSLFEPLGLSVSEWRVKPEMLVAAGEPAAAVTTSRGTIKATITVPHAGMISAVPGEKNATPDGPLFSLMYYEDGAPMLDPFAGLTEYLGNVRSRFEEMEDDLRSSIRKLKLRIGIGAGALAFLVAMLGSVKGAGLIIGLGLVAYFVAVNPKKRKLIDVRRNLQNFLRPASAGEVAQAAPQPPALASAPVEVRASFPPHKSEEAEPQPAASTEAPADIGVSSTSDNGQGAARSQSQAQPQTASVSPNSAGGPSIERRWRLAAVVLGLVAVLVVASMVVLNAKKKIDKSEKEEAERQTAKAAREEAAHKSMMDALLHRGKYATKGSQASNNSYKSSASVIAPQKRPSTERNPRSVVASTDLPAIPPGPIMIGNVDVSHFAGIRPGDTPKGVAAHFGRPTADDGSRKTYLKWLIVDFENGGAKAVHLNYWGWNLIYARLGHVNDDVMSLLSYSEARAIQRLGEPQQRESGKHDVVMSWSFADGRSEPGWLQFEYQDGHNSSPSMISVTW